MHKELIERLRTSPAFDNTTLGNEAADAIEDLQEILLNVENAHAIVADAYGNILRERDTLRQQLAESQAEVSRLEPLQFRQAPCHKFCEAMAFTIEIRNLKKQLAEAQAVIDASQCKGIPRKGCDYLTACGRVCNKCGEVHSAHQLATVFAAPAIADTVQRDVERYRFLRDHFATKSENSVDDFIALEPMTGEYFDAHIDILMSEFYAAMKGAA